MLATVKTSMHSFLGITSQVLLKFPEKYSGPEDYISVFQSSVESEDRNQHSRYPTHTPSQY